MTYTSAARKAPPYRSTAEVVHVVCTLAGITPSQMRSGRRGTELVIARTVVARLLRGLGCTLSAIGDAIDRDHSSIAAILRRRANAAGNLGWGPEARLDALEARARDVLGLPAREPGQGRTDAPHDAPREAHA